jgi:hypothetical protein
VCASGRVCVAPSPSCALTAPRSRRCACAICVGRLFGPGGPLRLLSAVCFETFRANFVITCTNAAFDIVKVRTHAARPHASTRCTHTRAI